MMPPRSATAELPPVGTTPVACGAEVHGV